MLTSGPRVRSGGASLDGDEDALEILPDRRSVLRVYVHAVSTAIDVRSTAPYQFAHLRLQGAALDGALKEMLPARACRGIPLYLPSHYDGVRSFFGNLKSKAFVKAQHRFACDEAD